jgi:hypothetical protein
MRPVRLLTVSALVPVVAAAALAVAPAAATAAPGRGSSAEPAALAEVRAATARYHRPEVALADGYHPTEECVASPDGGMGRHWVNPERLGSTDPARPGILLYGMAGDGRLRLVGVEYLVVDDDQDLSTDADRPSVLGQPFDGPMSGHEPDMPVHYDLHVWLWAHNPAGMFASWNPALSC